MNWHKIYLVLLARTHASWNIIMLCIGVILGILVAYSGLFSLPVKVSLVTMAIILMAISLISARRISLILALLAGCILGTIRTTALVLDRDYAQSFYGQYISVTGHVANDPEVDGTTISLYLDRLQLAEELPIRGTIYVRISGNHEISRSDYLTLEGNFSAGFGTFIGALWQPSVISIRHPNPPNLLLELRRAFSAQLQRFIPEPTVSLALGYLLGQRSNLPQELNVALQVVGLTHIVVASGYNLSVLVRLAQRLFQRVSRFAVLFSGFMLISAFIAVTGISPSMLRAGFVAGLALLFWYFGRRFHPAKLLVLAASLTLLYDPNYLINLGWLLSFASFVGVLLFAPLLTSYFYDKHSPSFIAATFIETVAAQLCCLPIVILSTSSLSILGIVTNVLILPTIPYAMLLSFLTGVLAFLPFISIAVGQLANGLLSYHIGVVHFFEKIDWAIISFDHVSPYILLLYLPIFALAVYFWRSTHYDFRPKRPMLSQTRTKNMV